jgi:hypothetical protein
MRCRSLLGNLREIRGLGHTLHESLRWVRTLFDFQKQNSVHGFLVAADRDDRPLHIEPFLRMRLFTCMRHGLASPPKEARQSQSLSMASERPILTLLTGCPPPTPTPSTHR